jgi:hypothetical protein
MGVSPIFPSLRNAGKPAEFPTTVTEEPGPPQAGFPELLSGMELYLA